jgi:hypothetical protein
MNRKIFVPALAALILLAGGAIATSALSSDARLSQCGADVSGNRVRASFELASPADIWKVLPAMGKAPELLEDEGPAFVVIFDGDYRAGWVGGATLNEQTVQNAVCVVTSSGSTNIYYDVSQQGINLPS